MRTFTCDKCGASRKADGWAPPAIFACACGGTFRAVDESKPFDPINRPQHYADRKIEPINVILDNGWAEGFCLGNAYKYMARAGKKPGEPYDKDLKKAKWYLDFWVKAVEEKRVDVPALLKGPQG